jgi:GNAT superfamily N-acetyltransferase
VVDPAPENQVTTYRRIPFELPGHAREHDLPDPAGISWRQADDDDELLKLLVGVLEVSIDPRDRASVEALGAEAVAAAMVRQAQSGHKYESDRRWWWVLDVDAVPSGFVMPVIFKGCSRDGLDEGTFYHLGVVPKQRGRALGELLLAKGTDSLLRHGVWRLFADTAAENAPMIVQLERQGWTRQPAVTVGLHPFHV